MDKKILCDNQEQINRTFNNILDNVRLSVYGLPLGIYVSDGFKFEPGEILYLKEDKNAGQKS